MLGKRSPIGVVLAGGRGTRMGGAKLTVSLGGRPLIEYPLRVLQRALPEVAVIAKRDVELPPLPGVMLWIEPDEPRHPLFGIVESLALAGGRAVLVCPADLPFVTPSLIEQLAGTDPGDAPAVIAAHEQRIQPLLGCYQPSAAALLAEAARRADGPARDAVAALDPRPVEVSDARVLFNVNSPEDLLVAQGLLDRDQPKVKS